jgi:hypothetical protein
MSGDVRMFVMRGVAVRAVTDSPHL